jgi:hypothetical protein
VRLALLLLLAATPASAEKYAAPPGQPVAVATAAIAEEIRPACSSIASARRRKDGSIRAICGDGRAFWIFRQRGYPGVVVLPCELAKDYGGRCASPTPQAP